MLSTIHQATAVTYTTENLTITIKSSLKSSSATLCLSVSPLLPFCCWSAIYKINETENRSSLAESFMISEIYTRGSSQIECYFLHQ